MNLEGRVQLLERQNRQFRSWLALTLLVLAALLFWGAAKPNLEVMQVRGLEVVDESGNTTAVLNSAYGHGVLRLSGPGGGNFVYLGADPRSGILRLNSKDGTNLIYVGVGNAASGVLKIKSSDGSDIIYAGGASTGSGGLIFLNNSTGETVVGAGVDESGNGIVSAYHKSGHGRSLRPFTELER